VLVTGYDILFFWVARMQLAGYEFTDRAPFHTVVLHGLVLDEHGQKMSKSKGNGIDPLEVIAESGADALRFAMSHASTGGQDVRWDPRRVEMGRNFCTKLWNAARFALGNLDGPTTPAPPSGSPTAGSCRAWSVASRAVTDALEAYDLGAATRAAYDFTWSEFCDWYLEAAKPALREGDPRTRHTLRTVLEGVLTLLHPIVPFVTSELWEAVGAALGETDRPQLAEAAWPTARGPERRRRGGRARLRAPAGGGGRGAGAARRRRPAPRAAGPRRWSRAKAPTRCAPRPSVFASLARVAAADRTVGRRGVAGAAGRRPGAAAAARRRRSTSTRGARSRRSGWRRSAPTRRARAASWAGALRGARAGRGRGGGAPPPGRGRAADRRRSRRAWRRWAEAPEAPRARWRWRRRREVEPFAQATAPAPSRRAHPLDRVGRVAPRPGRAGRARPRGSATAPSARRPSPRAGATRPP
jgi:hypothetical protein